MIINSNSTKNKVILDANAFFVPLRFKIDIFDELKKVLDGNFEPILLSPIRRELEKIAKKGSSKMQKNVAYALKLAEKCKPFKVDEKTAGSPDDAVVYMAKKWNCPVFTNDRELKKRLRDINVPVIYVRQKSRLEIDGRM